MIEVYKNTQPFYKIECPHCESGFRFQYADTQNTYYHNTSHSWITCPVCKKDINFNFDELEKEY